MPRYDLESKIEGKPAPPLEPQVECTYDHCDETFFNIKDMQRHKRDADMHFYCKKCDIDFSDDMQHIMHRVITRKKHSKAPAPLVSHADRPSYMPGMWQRRE